MPEIFKFKNKINGGVVTPLLLLLVLTIYLVPSAQAETVLLKSGAKVNEKLASSLLTFLSDSEAKEKIAIGFGDQLVENMPDIEKVFIVGSNLGADTSGYIRSTNRIIRISSTPGPEAIGKFANENFKNIRIGILIEGTDEEKEFIGKLQANVTVSSISIVPVEVKAGDTISGIKNLVSKNVDVVFIQRSSNIYKNSNLRFVMEYLFRQRVPVITTIPGLLKAGAVVSMNVRDEDVISEIKSHLAKDKKYSESDRSRLFYLNELDVFINEDASRFYNLGNVGSRK